MLNKEEATDQVKAKLLVWSKNGTELAITNVIETNFGWVFCYDTTNPEDPIAGNAPFFVNRLTGEIKTGVTYETIEKQIKELEALVVKNSP